MAYLNVRPSEFCSNFHFFARKNLIILIRNNIDVRERFVILNGNYYIIRDNYIVSRIFLTNLRFANTIIRSIPTLHKSYNKLYLYLSSTRYENVFLLYSRYHCHNYH